MHKPLSATLGDATGLSAADWRATMRANDVPRRPPPSATADRPDRGYVEQPEERVMRAQLDTMLVRRQVVIPASTPPAALVLTTSELQPQPETQPSEAPPQTLVKLQRQPEKEVTEMPRAKKKTRQAYPDELRQRAIKVYYEVREDLIKKGKSGRNIGATAIASKRTGVSESILSQWVMRDRSNRQQAAEMAPARARTLVSNGPSSAPTSGAVSVRGHLPPPPTVAFAGLEEYIQAIADRAVAAAMKRMLSGMAGGD